MAISNEARIILAAYNHLTTLLVQSDAGNNYRLLSFNQSNGDKADAIHAWLAERCITPMAYLAACFSKHAWRYKPKLGSLLNKKYIDHWKANRDDAYLWSAAIRQDTEAHQPVDLPVGKEIVKRRMLFDGGAEYCRAHKDLTGGFNEFSSACKACALREEC